MLHARILPGYPPEALKPAKSALFKKLGRGTVPRELLDKLAPPLPRAAELRYRKWVASFWHMWELAVHSELASRARTDTRVDAKDLLGNFNLILEQSGYQTMLGQVTNDIKRATTNYYSTLFKQSVPPPDTATLVKDWRVENIQLIKDVGDQQVIQLNELFSKAQQTGQRHEELVSAVQERLGVGLNRAKLIARDQTTKFNSTVHLAQAKAAGIEEFIWSTSKDASVRASHKALDGRTFRYDNPPIVDHERALPGQPIQCRCQAIPKVSLFDGL